MLPQMTPTRKSPVEAGGQHNHNDQASIPDQPSYHTKSVAPVLSDLGRSRSIRHHGSEKHSTEAGHERPKPMNVGVKAPRTSGIVAPHSKYDSTTSRNASKPNAQFANKPVNTTAVRSHESVSKLHLMESRTIGSVDPARTMSATKQVQPESTTQRHGRPSSKQLPVSNMFSMNLPSSKKNQRPAFSTLQQHFTPKKTSSVPTASFFASAPSKQDRDDTFSSEIGRLQTELAQLHMLHRNSAAIQAQWEQNAERSLRCRFEGLSKQHIELKGIASESQALINQSALLMWCHHMSDVEIAERVQLLSRCIVEIGSILNADSKLSRVLGLFGAWFDRASQIQRSRSHSIYGVGQNLNFIEGLGNGWIAEVDTLDKKLSSLLRELESLGEIPEESSISRVLDMVKSVVSNLMNELDSISVIENEIMTQETSWIQDMIKDLVDDVDNDFDATATSYRGIWG